MTATEPATIEKQYQFVEDVWVDVDGSTREKVEKGTTFNAVLAEETWVDRRGPEPKVVPMGRYAVQSADIDVLPGCLDSCIRTGRAVDVATLQKPAKQTKK